MTIHSRPKRLSERQDVMRCKKDEDQYLDDITRYEKFEYKITQLQRRCVFERAVCALRPNVQCRAQRTGREKPSFGLGSSVPSTLKHRDIKRGICDCEHEDDL